MIPQQIFMGWLATNPLRIVHTPSSRAIFPPPSFETLIWVTFKRPPTLLCPGLLGRLTGKKDHKVVHSAMGHGLCMCLLSPSQPSQPFPSRADPCIPCQKKRMVHLPTYNLSLLVNVSATEASWKRIREQRQSSRREQQRRLGTVSGAMEGTVSTTDAERWLQKSVTCTLTVLRGWRVACLRRERPTGHHRSQKVFAHRPIY